MPESLSAWRPIPLSPCWVLGNKARLLSRKPPGASYSTLTLMEAEKKPQYKILSYLRDGDLSVSQNGSLAQDVEG